MPNLKTNIYLLIWFSYIVLFAFLIPYYSNDFRYMLIEQTDDVVTNFYDILVSQYRHYFTWGGRTPPHVLAQTLLLCGKYVSSLATGLCYLSLVYLIYVFGVGRKISPLRLPLIPVVFITIGLWICLRAFGEVFFMLVSSCNYLYTTVFIMAYLLPFRFSIGQDGSRHGIYFAVLMFVLGVIAGWCNENTGFAICFVTGLMGLYFLIHKRLTLWQFTALAGMGIGFLILVLSPGNSARLNSMEKSHFEYASHIFKALQIFALTMAETLPLILAYVLLRYKVHSSKLDVSESKQLYGSYYALAVGFSSLFIMVFSPNFPARTAAPFTFFTLAACIALYDILRRNSVSVLGKKGTLGIIALSFVFIGATATNAVGALKVARADRVIEEEAIKTQIAEGKKDLILPISHVMTSRYIFVSEPKVSTTHFANVILARYYHVNTITKKCDFSHGLPHSDLMYFQRYGKEVCQEP